MITQSHVEHGIGETEITAGDLMAIWYGTENLKSITEKDRTAFLRAVAEDKQHFEISYDRTRVYIKTEDEAVPQRMDKASVDKFLKEKLKKYDLKTVSFIESEESEEKAVLVFNTFKYIDRVKKMLPELEEKIMWQIEIRPTPDWTYIKGLVRDRFAEEKIKLLKDPSDVGNKLIIKVEENENTINRAEKLVQELSRETGIEIFLDSKVPKEHRIFPPSTKIAKPHEIKPLVDEIINAQISDPEFYAKPSMDQENLVVTLKFVTPQYAERLRKEIETFEQRSGWKVDISPHARTDILSSRTQRILKNKGITQSKVSWHGTYLEIKIPKELLSEEGIKEKIKQELSELFRTGVEVKTV